MDGHNDLLGEISADAALERSDFLVQSTEQLRKFLDRHRERIATIGGMTLIDEEPDYLSIAPDLTFRSRSRYQDDVERRVDQRDRGHRIGGRARRALQPGRHLRLRSPRPPARPPASAPSRPRESDVLEAAGHRRRRGGRPWARPVRRSRRLVGRRPDAAARARPTTSRPPAACTTSPSNTRSAASAARAPAVRVRGRRRERVVASSATSSSSMTTTSGWS